jgi:hypothetical protein
VLLKKYGEISPHPTIYALSRGHNVHPLAHCLT